MNANKTVAVNVPRVGKVELTPAQWRKVGEIPDEMYPIHIPELGKVTMTGKELRTLRARISTLVFRVSKNSGRQGGRPRKDDRCPCGKMTRWLAEKRNHRCVNTLGEAESI